MLVRDTDMVKSNKCMDTYSNVCLFLRLQVSVYFIHNFLKFVIILLLLSAICCCLDNYKISLILLKGKDFKIRKEDVSINVG